MRSRTLLSAFAILVSSFAILLPRVASADAEKSAAVPEISYELRQELDPVLQAKVSALLNEKNEEGVPYKRATYSRNFKKVDNSTYQVGFHKDTASKDMLTTERYVLTLKKDPATEKWSIASEDLQDTYAKLYRVVPGTGEFLTFDSVKLQREGLKIVSGPGSLYRYSRNGKVVGFRFLTAEDFSYEYFPVEKKHQALFKKLKKDRTSDVLFNPDRARVTCDPVSCEDILTTGFAGLKPSSLDKMPKKFQDDYDKGLKDSKKFLKDNPFGGFRPTEDPARRYYTITLSRDNPDRGISLEYDNWEQLEVTFSAYGIDKFFPSWAPLYKYYSEASLKSGVPLYQLEQRDDSYARDYDLVGLNGTVELGIKDAEDLNADVTFTLKPKRELKEVPFFIVRGRQTEEEKKESKDPQMIINSIEDGEGHELTWVKLFASGGLVIMPKPVAAGSTVVLHMIFENKAAIVNYTPTFSSVSRFGWLPFVRFTDMINDFHLTVKAPAKKHILGVGRKVSDKVEGDVRVTEWVADSPVEFPSVTFGDYYELESKVEAKKIDGTKIPVWIHVDKSGVPMRGQEGTRIRDIIPINPKALQYVADQAANSLNIYREIYGVDYPYAKLDLVNDPLGSFYGQSPSSLIYLGEGVFASQGMAGEIGGAQLSKFNREVVPHEVGHQWWGSLIPNSNDCNYWFVESLAEYSSALFLEVESGTPDRKAYLEKVADWRREIMDTDLQASVQDASCVWSGHLGGGYRAAVYSKGPYVFHIMRSTWGDEKFFKFLKMLAQELKNKAIVTRDIQKVAEKAFGGNMDFFFDQWVRGVGTPEYTFTYDVRPAEDGKQFVLEGKVDQRVLVGLAKEVMDDTYYTAVIPISVIGKSGKEYHIPLRIQGASTPFKMKLPEAPKDMTFNKYQEALAYDVIVKKLG